MKFKWNVSDRKGSITQTVATNRGIASEDWQSFLSPSLRGLHDPMLMHDMRKAAERIVAAIKAKDKIVIYGDYDVDGITGTTTLLLAIKMFGGIVDFHIPHRVSEGYGLNSESLTTIINEGAKLIVSVDCGITGVEAAQTVKDRGIDLIITDHHEWKDKLPDCYAMVHPCLGEFTAIEDMDQRPTGDYHMEDSTYPNPFLCGSGVAFKVAWAIGMVMNDGQQMDAQYRPFFMNAIAFTALGTIADVVKLVGENRVIATCGLSRIRGTCFPGLKGFLASAKLEDEDVDGYKVGFTLAPRLNAAGRMGHASSAVRLLAEEDYVKAVKMGEELEAQNIKRQETEKAIVKEADAYAKNLMAGDTPNEILLIPNRPEFGGSKPSSDVLMVLGRGWHPGVIGIVASRICEKYHRPTLVLIVGEHHTHGSGRSVDGFNLTAAIAACGHLVKNYGGHAMACGLRIENDKIEQFREAICAYARDHQTVEMKVPEIKIECEAKLNEMDIPLCNELTRVGPYGPGNRRPFFVFRKLILRGPRRIGKDGQYLMFFGDDGQRAMKFVYFKPTDADFALVDGNTIDVVAEPAINVYNEKTTVQLMVRDMDLSANNTGHEVGMFA